MRAKSSKQRCQALCILWIFVKKVLTNEVKNFNNAVGLFFVSPQLRTCPALNFESVVTCLKCSKKTCVGYGMIRLECNLKMVGLGKNSFTRRDAPKKYPSATVIKHLKSNRQCL